MGIATKLNLLAISLILLTALAIGFAVVRTQSIHAFNALQARGSAIIQMLARGGGAPLAHGQFASLARLLHSLEGNRDVVYAAFYDPQRKLVAEHFTRAELNVKTPVPSWPSQEGKVRITELSSDLVSFVAAVQEDSAHVDFLPPSPSGYVQMVLNNAQARGDAFVFVNETLRFVIVVIALAIALTLLFTRRLIQPVQELAIAAHEVAEGQLGQTIQIHSNDEFADLSRAFQYMIDRLGASRARLLEYQNQLEDRVFARTNQLEQATAQAMDLAQRDTLTGLPNRAHFNDILEYAISRHHADGEQLALLFLDLDLFKRINDTLGHQAGDRLLTSIAEKLQHCVREGDLIARIGGDEFVMLARHIKSFQQVTRIARRILNTFSAPIDIAGNALKISFSIGISLCPEHGTDTPSLLRCADLAMYAAKEQGRGVYRFYTPDLNQRAMERLHIETGLRRALNTDDEFFLEFQPQIDLQSGKLVAAEALLRWRPSDGELISPARFIPVAEETGLILPIGERVLRNACAALARWQAAGLELPRIAINIAAPQFENRDFGTSVSQVLNDYGVPPHRLELELTESIIVRDADAALREMQSLKDLGVSIALDDFGTGYSSLSYLSRLPIDIVKIDRSFVLRSTEDRDAQTIVRSIVALAHALRYRVIAEGVETHAQLNLMRTSGCDYVQGYLLGRPMSEADLTAWLQNPETPAKAILREHSKDEWRQPTRKQRYWM
ncbi:MAG: EAL domain-containing protein [Betaproteobacteria bacterium]|nr:EAL domain-containing protein [Betaproteobacteria bacterium]